MQLFGFGVEVYIICLILAFPIYFIARGLSRKYFKTKRARMIATAGGTIVLTPVIYVSIILIWVRCATYYPDHDFDRGKWKTDKEKRYELTKDLINNKKLIGMSKAQVKAFLGDEGNKIEDNEWTYEIGYVPAIIGIDPNDIHIDFENNKVVRVIQH